MTTQSNRTKIEVAEYVLGVADVGASNAVNFTIPRGATLLRATALTVTAFNTAGTGTATLTVGDGTTTFANAVDIKSTGSETVANVPKHYADGGTVTATITETLDTTAATAGKVHLILEYVQTGTVCSIQD